MKALIEFAELPLQEQAQTIWDKGNYLLNRRIGKCTFSLYSLDNFFVEVWYDEEQELKQIIVLDSFIRLDAYLKTVSLKGLFV